MTDCDLTGGILLSGADGLRPVLIHETRPPGVVVHRSDPRVGVVDSITLYVSNIASEPVNLTVSWGSALVTTAIPPCVCVLLADSAAVNGDGQHAIEVRAFASVPGVVSVSGDGFRFGVPVRLH